MLLQDVAKTIYRQLGAGRFQAMTGAKDFIADERSLRFKVGKNAKGVTHVTITLKPSDTYTVTAERVRRKSTTDGFGLKSYEVTVTSVGERSDIYCEQLQGVFTSLTGLYTRF